MKTSGVFVRIVKTGGDNADGGNIRKGGSTDNRITCLGSQLAPNATICGGVGINSTNCFEQYITNTTIDIYVVAYTLNTTFTWYTNSIDVSLGATGSWLDIDATGNETGVFLEFTQSFGALNYGEIRKAGSTDDRTTSAYMDGIAGHIFHGCGLNSTEYFQGKISSTGVDFFLMGYTQNYTYQAYVPQIDNWSNVALIVPLISLFYILGVVVITALWIKEIPKICGSGGTLE